MLGKAESHGLKFGVKDYNKADGKVYDGKSIWLGTCRMVRLVPLLYSSSLLLCRYFGCLSWRFFMDFDTCWSIPIFNSESRLKIEVKQFGLVDEPHW